MKINIKRPPTVRSQSRWFPRFNLELRKPIYGNHNNMFFQTDVQDAVRGSLLT